MFVHLGYWVFGILVGTLLYLVYSIYRISASQLRFAHYIIINIMISCIVLIIIKVVISIVM